ncbi:MAG: hypothetical protein KF726_17620 [Anaerolineae bacterium]|nr:hypothetical protein [Anaerolineae bacterium]
MSKRRQKNNKSAAQSQPPQSTKRSTTTTVTSSASAKSVRKSSKSPYPSPAVLIGGVIVALVSGLALVFWRAGSINTNSGGSSSANITATAIAAFATPVAYTEGDVRYCTGVMPPFAKALGFNANVLVDTRARVVKGVQLIEVDQSGKTTRSYQHPSWTMAGYLGPQVTDRFGNIYLTPVPFINLLDNPVEKANIIYRIDANTGEMSPLVDLPAVAAPSLDNVYGLLGLAYDCDTNSLYASSVLGSTRDQQLGRLFRIDLKTGQVASILEGVDAFGLNVFNSARGKRLYFGRARVAEINSVSLDANGDFSGELRTEFSIADLGVSGDERARVLNFSGRDQLVIQIKQFAFNLVAPTESLQTALEYRYDSAADTWHLVNAYPVDS